jgi:hypothetical protein
MTVMRHESCLVCRVGNENAALPRLAVRFAESLGPDVHHHHHTVICEDCGSWWFDDVVLSPLGIPVPSRRDTVLCDCPEDGRVSFTRQTVLVRVPERDCHCTHAEISQARAAQ